MRIFQAVLGLALTTVLAGRAQAQQEVPVDEVLWPLTAQAEADLRAEKPALARARAEVVVRLAPSQAPGAIRARAVYDQTAAETGAPPPVEVVWEPMLAQAEADLSQGRMAHAAARAEAILRHLPPQSPQAIRAAEIQRSSSTGRAPQAPPGYQRPPGYQEAPPGYQTPPPGQYGPPGQQAPPGGGQAYVVPPEPVDETRRRGSEMVELYIFGSAFGVFTGLEVLVAADIDEEDTQLLGVVPMLTGLGGALTVYALDSGEGMRRGQPTAISTGIQLGLAEGLLLSGSFHRDLTTRQAFALTWGTTLGGALLGAGAAFALEPAIAHSRFVLSGGMWGASIMTLIAVGANPEDTQDGFRMVLGGFNAGVLLAAALAGPIDMDGNRLMLLNIGFFGGAGVGATIPLIVLGARDDDRVPPGTIATSVGIGAAAGLALVFILTQDRGEDATDSEAPAPSAGLEIAPLLAPAEGGGVLGVTGSF